MAVIIWTVRGEPVVMSPVRNEREMVENDLLPINLHVDALVDLMEGAILKPLTSHFSALAAPKPSSVMVARYKDTLTVNLLDEISMVLGISPENITKQIQSIVRRDSVRHIRDDRLIHLVYGGKRTF